MIPPKSGGNIEIKLLINNNKIMIYDNNILIYDRNILKYNKLQISSNQQPATISQ